MPQISAGILLHRPGPAGPEVLLVHPGGPFWARKDAGAWSIPKGLCLPGEDPADAARREFAEETGQVAGGELVPLGSFRQPSGKIIVAFASAGDFDPGAMRSNLFELEWPPHSGKYASFPEADRAQWFGPDEARIKIHRGQMPILAALLASVGTG